MSENVIRHSTLHVIESICRDPLMERDLYFLSVKEAAEIPRFELNSPHFVVLLAWDTSATPVVEISEVAGKLLGLGAVYFCCWGPNCEGLHDAIDQVSWERELADKEFLMTTWHEQDSLEETLWYFMNCTFPIEYYEPTMNASIAISIGNSGWSQVCESALADPRKFSENALEDN